MSTPLDPETVEGHAQAVEEYILEIGSVSFVEIERVLVGRGVDVRGEHAMVIDSHNLVMWAAMSEHFMAIMDALQRRKRIEPKPTSILVYLADGALLKFPVAQRARRYKEPHWAPLVWNRRRG
jgi:hypothetical protein